MIDNLLQDVGSFGRYQILTLVLCSCMKVFPAIFTLLPVITNFVRPFSCSQWANDDSANATCPEPGFTCESWNFSQEVMETTVNSQFNLVCDRQFLLQVSVAIYFAGFLVGCTLYGRAADRFGRRPMALLSNVNLLVASVLLPFAPYFWLYSVGRFVAGVGAGGVLTTLFTLMVESTDVKHRLFFCFMVTMGWSSGIILVAFLAFFIRNHVWLQMAICAIYLVFMLIVPFFLHESARWLYSMGHWHEFVKAIYAIARLNRKPVESVEAVQRMLHDNTSPPASTGISGSIWSVRFYPRFRLLLLVHWTSWLFVSCGYYMASLGIGLLGGNVFYSLAINGALEIICRCFVLFLSRWIGRVTCISVSFLIGGTTFLIGIRFMSNPDLQTAIIALNLAGKSAFLVAFEFVWIYSAEIFPTPIRNVGIGLGSTWARVGGLISPLLLLLRQVQTWAPFLLLGVLGIVMGFLSMCLPETMGKHLPETLDEAEKICEKSALRSWIDRCKGRKEEEEDEEEKEETAI